MKYRYIFTSLILLLITSCNNINDSQEDPIFLQLDKSSFSQAETAIISINNTLGFDLKLLQCGFEPGFDIEKMINGEFEKPYDIDCEGIGAPFFISKGDIFEHEIHFPIFPQELDEIDGTYMLNFWLRRLENGVYINIADSLATTKPFTITSN